MNRQPHLPPKDHLAALDSLRGLAALSVVLFHIRLLDRTIAAAPLLSLGFVRNAYLMVDFFFVLSGFVIALNYRDRIVDMPSTARFVWLRFWRLYPLHLAFLFVFLLFEIFKWIAQHRLGLGGASPAFGDNSAGAFLANLTLLQAFGLIPGLTFNQPAWSIGAEFYAYLVFAAVVLSTRRVIAAAALIAAASAAVLGAISPDGLFVMADYGFIRCLFGFFLGVMAHGAYAAIRFRVGQGDRRSGRIAAGGAVITLLAIVILLSVKPAPDYDFALPPLAAVLVLSIALAPDIGLARLLLARPLLWLGAISYSIYMSHWAVLFVATNVLQHVALTPQHLAAWNGIVVVACLAAVLALSHATYTWIETPFRDWSRKVRLKFLPLRAMPTSR